MGRRLNAGKVFQSKDGRVQMGCTANAAHAGCDDERILGSPTDHQLLKAPVEGADTSGINDHIVLKVNLKLKVSFNPVQVYIDGYT